MDREQVKREASEYQNMLRLQKEAQDRIDRDYADRKRSADADYRKRREKLANQMGSAVGNPELQTQLSNEMSDLDKSYKYQLQSLEDAHKQTLKKTQNVNSYSMKGALASGLNSLMDSWNNAAAKIDSKVASLKQKSQPAQESEQKTEQPQQDIDFNGQNNENRYDIDRQNRAAENQKYNGQNNEERYKEGQVSEDKGNQGMSFSNNPQQFTAAANTGVGGEQRPTFQAGLYNPSLNLNEGQKEEQKESDERKRKFDTLKNQKAAGDEGGMSTRDIVWSDGPDGKKAGVSPVLQAVDAMDRDTEEPEGAAGDSGSWKAPYYYTMGRYLARKMNGGVDPMGRSAHLQRQAELHDIEAADHQRAMQRNTQIANQNYRTEAEKNAASAAAAENAQLVRNLGNAGAGAAALERGVTSADYNTMMQRQDAQRREGVENMEKMYDDRQISEQERSGADVYDYTARDMADYNARSNFLSLGGPQSDRANRIPKPKAKVEEPVKDEDVVEPQPETEEEEQQSPFSDKVSLQDVLNYTMSKMYDKVKAKHPDVPSNNDTRGLDWKEISRRKDHTMATDKELDVPEYHQAVEDVGNRLMNGEQVTIKGKTYGGKDAVDAVYDLYTAAGGAKGDVEWRDEEKRKERVGV